MTAAGVPLARRLGVVDAVSLGLGGMIGTGVFVVAAPAAALAGRLVVLSLLLAGAVAAANATSAARLAARLPVSGGAYHWGRELVHPLAGSLAGWCFVVGKIASAAAAALTVGAYVAAALGADEGVAGQLLPRGVALLTVVAVTTANVLGIRRTATASRLLVGGVFIVLLVVVAVAVVSPVGGTPVVAPVAGSGPGIAGVLGAAGLFFFAFAGYARIATLGEEVRDPARVIPLAVGVAFAVTVLLYVAVVVTAVSILGVERLAAARTPVADLAVSALPAPGAVVATTVVAVAVAAAATAVALGVQAGVSRVLLAMARTGELPRTLSVVHPRRGTPHRADLLVGIVVAVVALTGGLVTTVAVSAVTVLAYYAVANAAAARLPGRAGRVVAVAGLAGCLGLAGVLSATWGSG